VGDAIDAYIPLLESALRDASQRTGLPSAPRGVHPLVSDIVISHRHHDHHAGLPSVLHLLHTLSTELIQSDQKKNSLPRTAEDPYPYCPPRVHKFPSVVGRKTPLFSAEAEGATFEYTLETISSRLSSALFEHDVTSISTSVAETPHPRLLVHDLADGQVLTTHSSAPIELKVLHTPGHTTDSISLLLPSEGAMFTADTVLGEGTAVFEDLASYMTSLGRMRGECRPLLSNLHEDEGVVAGTAKMRIYPGHGPVIEDGLKVLETYITHRAEREAQILSLLPDENSITTTSNVNTATGTSTISSIVRTIYARYPPSVWPAAERGVWLHLEKLKSEDKVVRIPSPATAPPNTYVPSQAMEVEGVFRNILDATWARRTAGTSD